MFDNKVWHLKRLHPSLRGAFVLYLSIVVITCFMPSFVSAEEPVPLKAGAMAQEMTGNKPGNVSMDLENTDLKNVLKAFSLQTGISMIATSSIESKKVTVYLNNVSMDEALASILDANGLTYEKQDGGVYLIKPTGKAAVKTITKVFRLNYLQVYKLTPSSQSSSSTSNMTIIGQPAIAEAGSTNTSMANETPSPSSASSASSGSSSGGQPVGIMDILSKLMSKYGKITSDRRNNSLIVTDIPDVFPEIEKAIEELDTEPEQIMIQAEIVETTTVALKKIGLEYGSEDYLFKATYTGQDSDTPPSFPTPLPFTQSFLKHAYGASLMNSQLFQYGTIQLADVDIVLKLLAQDDDTTFLSRPKIMTVNNEPAIIKISANTAIGTSSSSVTQTGQTISTAERAETGIILKVTPQVNKKGDIFMLIEPSISRVKASVLFPTTFMDPSTRSSSSTVLIRDNDTVVVAGLISKDDTDTTRKVPFLGDIPFIGKAFQSRSTNATEVELLIFITPHVVKKRDSEYVAPQSLSNREYVIQDTMRRYQTALDKRKKAVAAREEVKSNIPVKKGADKAMDAALTNFEKKDRRSSGTGGR